MPDGDPGFRDVLKIREVRATVVGTFVIMLGFGILLPVLPTYARTFDVGYDAVGLLIAGFNLTRLVADPFVGRFIDRYGERGMTAAGAIIVGASSIAAGLGPPVPLPLVFKAGCGVRPAPVFSPVRFLP